jgi:hypothetical protein
MIAEGVLDAAGAAGRRLRPARDLQPAAVRVFSTRPGPMLAAADQIR